MNNLSTDSVFTPDQNPQHPLPSATTPFTVQSPHSPQPEPAVQQQLDGTVSHPHTVPLVATQNTTPIMSQTSSSPSVVVLILSLALFTGVATGYGSFQLFSQQGGRVDENGVAQPVSGKLVAGAIYGIEDTSEFEEKTPQGYLQIGGIEGEGSHHLLRPGGPSQSVYLTSSVIDLDQFEGAEVKVWGNTNKGHKAGWLMDVGRVEIIAPEGISPEAE